MRGARWTWEREREPKSMTKFTSITLSRKIERKIPNLKLEMTINQFLNLIGDVIDKLFANSVWVHSKYAIFYYDATTNKVLLYLLYFSLDFDSIVAWLNHLNDVTSSMHFISISIMQSISCCNFWLVFACQLINPAGTVHRTV